MRHRSPGETLTRLYLIRHGQAYSNVEPIIGGMKGDRGLTRLGIQQAEALRDRLATHKEIEADVLLASTLPRAVQTAEIIAPAIGRDIIFDDELHEFRPGETDGMSIDEARSLYPPVDFAREPFTPVNPTGESWASFLFRCGQAIERIIRQHAGKSIVVVTHGGFINASFIYFFQMTAQGMPAAGFYTHNTAITLWEEYLRFERKRWRLRKYNDDAHLLDIDHSEKLDWERPQVMADDSEPSVPLPTEPVKD